ncbi:hypothetical protein [Streptomyces indicus]|uniref:Uncharacterized protein n=1 Tax=Streptomyces indicus TaxID=417292 RepID=A0A1G9ETX8_9ACTN|nr:hypothetical protein [Streptomyces indicus]SDK79488.1 hypothetical protein SAMN05421806_11256 [Streptomyces indicus]
MSARRLRALLRRRPKPLPPGHVGVVRLTNYRPAARGSMPASYARFQLSKRLAYRYDVRAYPTTDREGMPLTVAYTRTTDTSHPDHADDVVCLWEFPNHIELPTAAEQVD